MKTRQVILKGYANNTAFLKGLEVIKRRLSNKGYTELNTAFDTLRGKNATEKVVVKAWYWRGNWSDPEKRIYTVFYK